MCDANSEDHVAMFSNNHPTVSWFDRLVSKISVVSGQLLRALAIRLKIKGASLLTPFHIAGNQNDMVDILSRSFGSKPKWYCKTDTDFLLLFNNTFSLLNKAS